MAIQYRIPVWATVGRSYRLALDNSSEFIRIARWWLLIELVAFTAYNYLIWPEVSPLLCFAFPLHDKAAMNQLLFRSTFATLPLTFFYLFIGASIAVAWHRLILRAERVTTQCYLRWDRVVAGYFGYGVLLTLLQKLPNMVNVVFNSPSLAIHTLSTLGGLVLTIFVLLFVIRVTPILPAAALEEPLTLRKVWNRTRSNFWRLLLGMTVCGLPGIAALLVPIAAKLVFGSWCMDTISGPVFYSLINLVTLVLVLPVLLSYLSLSYQYFFEGPAPADAPEVKVL